MITLLMLLSALAAPAVTAAPVTLEASRLAAVAGAHCDVPMPSPDGRWLAYVIDRDADETREVMLYDRAAGKARRVRPRVERRGLLDRVEGVGRRLGDGGGRPSRVCHEFAWQPGSATGAYTLACDNGGRQFDLFYTRAVGAPPRAITADPASDMHPRMAPAPATAVAFASRRSGNGDLFVLERPPAAVGPSSPSVTRLVASDSSEMSPVWAPDGRRLVYVRETASGASDLMRVEPGEKPRQLTRLPGAESEPAWSPDGTRLAFFNARPDGKRFDLYVMGSDGAAPELMARDVIKADGVPPAWTPDGEGIVYATADAAGHPLRIRWLASGTDRPIDGGTVLNRGPSVVALDDGRWWLVWTATAADDDTEKRWRRIYGAVVDPERLRP